MQEMGEAQAARLDQLTQSTPGGSGRSPSCGDTPRPWRGKQQSEKERETASGHVLPRRMGMQEGREGADGDSAGGREGGSQL